MQFALLGDHPDGLDLARTLVESGRHTVSHYCGPAPGAELLTRWNILPRREGDMEAVLAEPAVSTVIIASKLSTRAAQLRRTLQSERHALCIHPADVSPDVAYEAAMIREDAKQLLVPILPEALHPAFRRLAELLPSAQPSSVDSVRLIEMERWFVDDVCEESDVEDVKAHLPGWDVLRLLGGEIDEVSALAASESMEPNRPVVVSGQFTQTGLFQASFVPEQSQMHWRISAVTATGHIQLLFDEGWPGPATLSWTDDLGETHSESWETWNPWPVVVEAFESALSTCHSNQPRRSAAAVLPDNSEHIQPTSDGVSQRIRSARPDTNTVYPTWNDETRALELDDAVRRSVEKRRTSVLDFQEVTEDATVKGTMTLVGCSIIWISLLLLILSAWVPWLAWFIVPAFVFFLVVQVVLRWVVRPAQNTAGETEVKSSAESD